MMGVTVESVEKLTEEVIDFQVKIGYLRVDRRQNLVGTIDFMNFINF